MEDVGRNSKFPIFKLFGYGFPKLENSTAWSFAPKISCFQLPPPQPTTSDLFTRKSPLSETDSDSSVIMALYVLLAVFFWTFTTVAVFSWQP